MSNAYSARPALALTSIFGAAGIAWFGALLVAPLGCAQPSSNGTGTGGTGGTPDDPYAGFAAKALHVSGPNIVDTTGATVRLLGVNRSGSEYMCVPPTMVSSTFDGPTGPNTITAMKSWHINTVRLPLNESCWLGVSGALVPPDQYIADIEDYVQRLHAQGIYVVLDLHWSSPSSALATFQTTMAFAAHASAFWTSVATTFKTDPMIIFDLYNEPILDASDGHGNNAVGDANAAWTCWLNGCGVTSGTTAGMQSLVTAVRSAGANQIIIVNGIDWAHKLDQWLTKKPSDPANNLIAGVHIYNDGACNTQSCWDSSITPVATSFPVITGELGERDCAHSFIDGYMAWADMHGVSYLGWAWNNQNCSTFPALVSDNNGTPSAFGQGLHDHLLQIVP
jgi:hypothetical protein